MSYPETAAPERPWLKVLQLNTCHTGRQYQLTDAIFEYIDKNDIHVVLGQEFFGSYLERLRNALGGGEAVFSPNCNLSLTGRKEDAELWGNVIGSRMPIGRSSEIIYAGSKERSLDLNLDNSPASCRSIIIARIDDSNFETFHGTWHNSKVPSPQQLKDFAILAHILRSNPGVLGADCNSGRGYEIYDSIEEIVGPSLVPEDQDTTFDTGVRPEATQPGVVIGLFVPSTYEVRKVKMVRGLSDHQAIQAEVRLRVA